MKVGLIAAAVVWVVLHERGWLGGIVAVLVGLASWWIESRLWPELDCWWPWCRGGIVSYSPFTPHARRRCRVCGGSGKRRRFMARAGR